MEVNGRKVVIKSLFGSENYNLNTKISDNLDIEPSDKDYKIWAMPSFYDLYSAGYFYLESVGEKEDLFAIDIRKFPGMLYKTSINMVEILYSTDIFVEGGGYSDINKLFDIKDDIAKINLTSLFGTSKGAYFRNMKELQVYTKSTRYLGEKFNYNTKKAVAIYRTMDCMERFHATGYSDFKKAIRYDDKEREFILDIKTGKFSLEEFIKLAEHKYQNSFIKLEEDYCGHKNNDELSEYIHSIVNDVVFKNRMDCFNA